MTKTIKNYRSGRQTEKVTMWRFEQPTTHRQLDRNGEWTEWTGIGVYHNERRYDGEITLNGYWLMISEKSALPISRAELDALIAA